MCVLGFLSKKERVFAVRDRNMATVVLEAEATENNNRRSQSQ